MKQGLPNTNVKKIPSGRAMAAECFGIHLVNVYAPSGTAMRREREEFYSAELSYILRTDLQHVILGGGN
jgi:exonuclease III